MRIIWIPSSRSRLPLISSIPSSVYALAFSTAVAICIWSAGSFLTSWDAYHQSFIWRGFGETGYILFYPFLFFGLLRTLTVGRAFKPLEIFDVIIITLGASSVISSFFLRLNQHSDTFTYFLSIFYPIADSLVLIFVTAIVMMQKISWRSALTFLGILSFATSDYLFLFQYLNYMAEIYYHIPLLIYHLN